MLLRIALCMTALMCLSAPAFAEEKRNKSQGPVEILEDEKVDVEADLPSVEFVMNFKGLKYESLDKPASFLKEILNSVEKDPF